MLADSYTQIILYWTEKNWTCTNRIINKSWKGNKIRSFLFEWSIKHAKIGVGNLKLVMTYCRRGQLLDALASNFFFAYSSPKQWCNMIMGRNVLRTHSILPILFGIVFRWLGVRHACLSTLVGPRERVARTLVMIVKKKQSMLDTCCTFSFSSCSVQRLFTTWPLFSSSDMIECLRSRRWMARGHGIMAARLSRGNWLWPVGWRSL
jgi:hypothetical protein